MRQRYWGIKARSILLMVFEVKATWIVQPIHTHTLKKLIDNVSTSL